MLDSIPADPDDDDTEVDWHRICRLVQTSNKDSSVHVGSTYVPTDLNLPGKGKMDCQLFVGFRAPCDVSDSDDDCSRDGSPMEVDDASQESSSTLHDQPNPNITKDELKEWEPYNFDMMSVIQALYPRAMDATTLVYIPADPGSAVGSWHPIDDAADSSNSRAQEVDPRDFCWRDTPFGDIIVPAGTKVMLGLVDDRSIHGEEIVLDDDWLSSRTRTV